jgi:pimeloyl-ACP methyl ester carboxylesterase
MADFGAHRVVSLRGAQIAYRVCGDQGPVVVLLHGVADTGRSWDTCLSHLAIDGSRGALTVVVPDLLGHGLSARPRTDYSVGAHANILRDLLDELGHTRVTLIGHSLGGGVAMHFAYQFPGRCEALMLVASGGLGGEISAALRAAALPGSELVLRLLTATGIRRGVGVVAAALAHAPIALPDVVDSAEVLRVYLSLDSTAARSGFLLTLRAVIDPFGQRVSAVNWLPAAARVPTMIVWGGRDPIIPVQHAQRAHELISGSQLVIFPEAGHFPHRHDPTRFAELVLDFVHRTQPASQQPPYAPAVPVPALHDRRVLNDRRVLSDRRQSPERRATLNTTSPPISQIRFG